MSLNDLPGDVLEQIVLFLSEESLINFCSLGSSAGFEELKRRFSRNQFSALTCNQWTRALKLLPLRNFERVDRQLARIIRLDHDVDLFFIRSLILCRFPARKRIVDAVLCRSDWRYIFAWDFVLTVLREPNCGGHEKLFERMDRSELLSLPVNTKAGLLLEGAPISVDDMVSSKAAKTLLLDKCRMQLMSYNWSFKKLERCLDMGAAKSKDIGVILLTLIEQMNICFEDAVQMIAIIPDKSKCSSLACRLCAAMASAFTDPDLRGVQNPFDDWKISKRMEAHMHLTLVIHNKFKTIDAWDFDGKHGNFLRNVSQNPAIKTTSCHSVKLLRSIYRMQRRVSCEMISMLNVMWWHEKKEWVCVCKQQTCLNKQRQLRTAKRKQFEIPDQILKNDREEMFVLFGPSRVSLQECDLSRLIDKVLEADVSAFVSAPSDLVQLIPQESKMLLWQKAIRCFRTSNRNWAMNMTYTGNFFDKNWFPTVEEMLPMLEIDGVHTVRFLSRQRSFTANKFLLLDVIIENHYFSAFSTMFNFSPIVHDLDAIQMLFLACFQHGFMKACGHVYSWDPVGVHAMILRHWDSWHHMCAHLGVTSSVKFIWLEKLTLEDIRMLRQSHEEFDSVVSNIFIAIREESLGNFICTEFIERVGVVLSRDCVVSLIHIGVNWNHIRTFLTRWAHKNPSQLALLVDCLDNSSSIYHRHWAFQLKKHLQ